MWTFSRQINSSIISNIAYWKITRPIYMIFGPQIERPLGHILLENGGDSWQMVPVCLGAIQNYPTDGIEISTASVKYVAIMSVKCQNGSKELLCNIVTQSIFRLLLFFVSSHLPVLESLPKCCWNFGMSALSEHPFIGLTVSLLCVHL